MEALHHIGALDLTLHHRDGSLIPTEDVGLQDCDRLLELARADESELGFDDPEHDELSDPELERIAEHDAELLGSIGDSREGDRAWTPDDDEETESPRYQIFVLLERPNAIP